MKTLKLKNSFQTNATLIANDFIDNYMIHANGEFVKVYLFLLRHLEDSDSPLTVSIIADCLNHTEKDILRAFRYWENTGLVVLEYDSHGQITGIELKQSLLLYPSDILDKTSFSAVSNQSMTERTQADPHTSDFHAEFLSSDTKQNCSDTESSLDCTDKPVEMCSFKAQKELKSLLFIAEQYLGKTLTHTDVETITYFYDVLKMSAPLIEYLIESCVEGGHKSLHYIKKVAYSWTDKGIRTVEQAQQNSACYNKMCFTVLKAFGIKNRYPASSELIFINRWTQEYNFSAEIIEEACRRTISSTHQPSFEYTERILKNWFLSGVKSLSDISALDKTFQKEHSMRNPQKTEGKSLTKNMNNFESRTYDMDSLEAQLLNSN